MAAATKEKATPAPAQSRLLMSGNDAVSRAVWEAGVRVAAAYPGTPATEMLEVISTYPDIYAEWSVNEKVSLEVAFGASMAGSRSFCAMKHVGMNVASDALMTMTLTGVAGGLAVRRMTPPRRSDGQAAIAFLAAVPIALAWWRALGR